MGKYRIMIIDDDADTRHLIGLALRPRYEAVEVCDGLDALSKLELYEPDFAIIDIAMPVMDGFQVCEAIRHHQKFNSMQVMFLSGHDDKESIKKSYAVGANLFMTKPVDPERILKNIDFTIAHTPPPLHVKRHTTEEIERLETESRLARQQQEQQEQQAISARPEPKSTHPVRLRHARRRRG